MKPYYQDNAVTIYLGDCRSILPSLPKVDLVLTDPPYGIGFESGWDGLHGSCEIQGDTNTTLRDDALGMLQGISAIVFGSWKVAKPNGTKAVLIWDKGGHSGMGDLSFPWKPNTEEIYVIGNGFTGERTTSVLYFPNHPTFNANRVHPFEKPIALVESLMAKSTGNLILDPFMGSGTTLRAAKNLGRKAIGIEIEEKYCEIAAKRMAQTVMNLEV